jgi:Mrp family chromosome partitioning ATPase
MTDTRTAQTLGRVTTFYSYKGGTGRTMALANVAWLLASNGHRVLAIDWDLESPGLHRYYHPFLKDKELRSSEGVMDLVQRFADAALRSGAEREALADLSQVREYAVSLAWEFPGGGVLDLVPAGRQDDAYARKVSTFDWDSFWTRLRGGAFIDALRENMRRQYDFVLIDSRTGTSDTAGICTIQLPDSVVNCFTLNKQSIDGAVAISNSILRQCREPMTVYPVPTRIEDGEKLKLDRGRSYSRRGFAHLLAAIEDEDAEAYWDAAEIPYVPYYAYEEVLAVFGDRPRQENSLLARYQRLASRLAGRDCAAPQLTDAERTRVLRAFEQSAPADPLTIVVAYAPLDRIWAEWLHDRLSRAGQHVRLHCVASALPAMAGVDRLVVVSSRDLAAYPEGTRAFRLAEERAAAGEDRFLATVRVDATAVTEQLPPRALVDVMGVQEPRALAMVYSALDLDDERRDDLDADDAIRYPAVRTPHWNIELARNGRFSGRGAVLEEVRDRLLAEPAGSRLVLTGLPGVGKTQVALEYVYRFAASYEVIWWVSVTEAARLRIGLAGLAKELKLRAGESVDEQVAAVREALRRGAPERRWLLVLDNADEPADVAGLLPTGPGHLLITSRNPQWSQVAPHLDVNVFHREESVELLRRRVGDIPAAAAATLAARLGDLPLAVEQAGGWLASTGMAVEDYLKLFDRSMAHAMEDNAPAEYTQPITSTVRLAYDELARRNPAAARLLELFAFLAPEAIPYRLISNKSLAGLLSEFDPRMHDPMLHATLNREIGRYGLARVDAGRAGGLGGIVVHRLTQDIVRSQLSDEQQRQRRAEAQAILAAADRGSPDDPLHWPAFEALRPHLAPSGALAAEAPEVRQLVIDMVRYLWQRGDYPSSEELARAALKEWLPTFGADDPLTLRLNYQLGVALRAHGLEHEAYELNRDSHERLLRTLGEAHPYTLSAATSLGADLRGRGDYHEARELDERTVKGMRAVLDDDDTITLNAVNNLAVSLRLVGEFGRAAELDRQTLERRRRVLGLDHPDVMTIADNHGTGLRELGDLAASRNTLEATYETSRRVLGADHWRTLRAGKSYAVTLRRLGQVPAAAELAQDVADRAEATVGRHHPLTAACRLELACARWAEGRHDDARKIAAEAHAVYRELRGERHPFTLAAANNLSIFLRCAGEVDAARRLAQRTAEALEAVLGPRHPHALAGEVTLANALYADGARAAARQRDEAAYRRLRIVLGEGHPTVLVAALNQAVSHRADEPERSAKLRDDALRGLRAALGDAHPHAAAARDWRRVDVDTEPLPT